MACQRLTYLLPKSDDTNNPKNYDPITFLTTIAYSQMNKKDANAGHTFIKINY